jgi:hypothetical protein
MFKSADFTGSFTDDFLKAQSRQLSPLWRHCQPGTARYARIFEQGFLDPAIPEPGGNGRFVALNAGGIQIVLSVQTDGPRSAGRCRPWRECSIACRGGFDPGERSVPGNKRACHVADTCSDVTETRRFEVVNGRQQRLEQQCSPGIAIMRMLCYGASHDLAVSRTFGPVAHPDRAAVS